MEYRIDFQPIGRVVTVSPGMTVLEAAQKAGIGLSAVCGGQSACGTCLVRISKKAPVTATTALESRKIDQVGLNAGMRLACQVILEGSTSIEVPKDSLTALQRTQIEGEERKVPLEPPVVVYNLKLPPASQTNLDSDWEQICRELSNQGVQGQLQADLSVLKCLPEVLRNNEWSVQIGLRKNDVISVSAKGRPVLGLAVDLGTTKIAAYLVDLQTGDTLAMEGIMNPQIVYGEDLMARIAYTMKNEDGLKVLQNSVIQSINELAQSLCRKAAALFNPEEEPNNTLAPTQIVEMVLVGNTAMHHIFLGLPVRHLGLAPYVGVVSETLDVRTIDIGLDFASAARVHVLPNIAGFVGADHVSMLLATSGFASEKTTIYLDIGTNTEISLMAEGRLVSCSTASGPAFEGAHIEYGMRAADGAVERVRITDNRIEYQTIGNCEAVGLCGSGILDAVAQLRLAEAINFRGAIEKKHELVSEGNNGMEVVIVPAKETKQRRAITINRKDISEIQMAKGAIRAGIELLLDSCNKTSKDIDSLIIAGAFGTFIDIESAITIGMFPDIPRNRFKQVGNAAGIGAKLSLLSIQQRALVSSMRNRFEYLELANHPNFTDEFAKAMSM